MFCSIFQLITPFLENYRFGESPWRRLRIVIERRPTRSMIADKY